MNTVLRRRTMIIWPSSAIHAVFRIGVGLLFMEHGLQKMLGWFGGPVASLQSLMGVAGVLELVGGLMLALGLLTRPVAMVLVIEMVVAYFMVHAPRGPWPIQNGGELALLYALTFAFFAANGAGTWSLDRRVGGDLPWTS